MTNPISVGLELTSHADDPMILRRTFGHFPSGVSVHAVEIDGEKHALVASSFMVGVSLEPALVAVAVQEQSSTWPILREADRFGVSIFGSGQGDMVRQLAGKDKSARFNDVPVQYGERGALFVNDASIWLEVSTHEVFTAGDHIMALLQVHRAATSEEREPLVWHGSGFRDLVSKGSVDVQ